MAHQYMPKIFHDPYKNPPAPPPTYIMYGPLWVRRPFPAVFYEQYVFKAFCAKVIGG